MEGIIYIMETSAPNTIKIGKTGVDSYKRRMYDLEHDGYNNVNGLHRYYAIKVKDYHNKEIIIHKVLDRYRNPGTELFTFDKELAAAFLSCFEGEQIYPPIEEQEVESSFDYNEEELDKQTEYYLERPIKQWNQKKTKGRMKIVDDGYCVLAGSLISPYITKKCPDYIKKLRESALIIDNVLQENIVVGTPTGASSFIIGGSCNGWTDWKDKDGNMLKERKEELQNKG